MFSYFRKSWETGIEGNLIEDMIQNAFRDFAPYAGADQQQIRCIRRQSDGTNTSLIYEEDGEWSVRVANPHVGTVAFTTTREVLFDLRARIPLRWGRRENNDNSNNNTINSINSNNNNNNNSDRDSGNMNMNNSNKESDYSGMRGSPHDNNEASTLTNENNASHDNNNNNNNNNIEQQQEQQEHLKRRRFFPSTNIHPSYHTPGTIGVLELLSSPASKRHGVGLSLGPFSLRATTLPPINTNNNNNNTINASDTAKSTDNTSSMLEFYRNPFVVDASFCTSLHSILPEKLSSMFPASCYISTALQHPVGAIEGETLGAISLRSLSPNRINSINTSTNTNTINNTNNINSMNSMNSSIGDHYMSIWDECDDFNLLVVQTLMKTAGSRNVLDDTTVSRSSLLARDSSWRELGTLIGLSKSFSDGLIRLSASAMFHERDIDYEAAATVDATALLANPTLLKVGVNGIGRVGVSIATKLFDSLTITLGMHQTREADMRFGLEIAV